jgi:hypothetical protein
VCGCCRVHGALRGDAEVVTLSAPTREIGYTNPNTGNWWSAPDEERTPELRWPQSVEVYDQMRSQDAQVGSVLEAITLPVRSVAWRLDPGRARDEVVEHIAADLGLPILGEADPEPPLRTRDRFSWDEHLYLALLMLPFGHSFFEQRYRIDSSGRARLVRLSWRPPRTISRINVGVDGGLESIQQFAGPWVGHGPGGVETKPIPVNRLVAYVRNREGGNWLGRSVLRNAYKNWLIKDRLLRTQAQTIDRNGMGVPLYKGAENETTLDNGAALAKAWRAGDDSGAAVPFGADLILRGVEGDLPDADPAIRYHDEQIARTVLAHFLNLGTQTGSWALGTTFADFFILTLKATAKAVQNVANAHVVEDLVDVNWGEDEPAPRIVHDKIGSEQAATAQAIKMLSDAGVLLPDKPLEEAVRTAYGLPPKGDSPPKSPGPPDSPSPGGGS